MKNLRKFMGGGISEYSAPSVRSLEVVTEKGFAASGDELFDNDALNDAFGDWGTLN